MEKRANEILIIKTGYSEFLEDVVHSTSVSFGDVFRITPLLELYRQRGDSVTWLTDEKAFPLLEGNPGIKELVPLTVESVMGLLDRQFDSVINLEKRRELCQIAEKIEAWSKYGFRIDRHDGTLRPYDRAAEALTVSSDQSFKRNNKRFTQDLLFELVGAKWNGEEYSLGYCPQTTQTYDVALNMVVGKKWPIKAWASENWNSLEALLQNKGLTVTRQDRMGEEIFTDLRKYIDWINSSRVFVTSDSLGMHLAIALKKKVIGLFGPTPSSEVCFYGRGEAILPDERLDCLPCFKSCCEYTPLKSAGGCMTLIKPENVLSKVLDYVNK